MDIGSCPDRLHLIHIPNGFRPKQGADHFLICLRHAIQPKLRSLSLAAQIIGKFYPFAK